ncbi:hypothetical protein H6P81_002294 [Aristolochia fimbriata]|uniref:AIPP2-like SPOC-like domain-containing protein n=1 Tax=Aristolochia fimbriata TaxID=158543 RepID=A0AAV7FD83_ARIFI|nr:hypothetical protein H6P81_002294 [Aristolochia fimbriata]
MLVCKHQGKKPMNWFLDDDDVALYFLPSDCESSKERYIHFLKMIDTSDLAIRCHFKGQTLSSSYRLDLTLEDIEKLIDDLVRETTIVWQMDEFRCRKPTTIDEAKAGVGRGCCEPFFLFILLAPTNKLLSCDVASKCEHLYQL